MLKDLFNVNLLKKILFLVLIIFIKEVQAENFSNNIKQNFTKKNINSKMWINGVVNPSFNNSKLLRTNDTRNEEYPAYELYAESWNTNFLKAYSNIFVPDSFKVDVSNFVIPFKGKITSHYGFRKKHFHYGIDIKLEVGDTICAAFNGKVRVRKYDSKGYGYYLVLRHPNGLETVYGHLSEFLVNQDANVYAGQPIGLGGNTGHSNGAHLHFEFRFLGNAINPAEIINCDKLVLKDDIFVYVKNKSDNNYNIDNSLNQYNYNCKTSFMAGENKFHYHRIIQGDTLESIAKKYETSVNELCKINKIKSTDILTVGSSIQIL